MKCRSVYNYAERPESFVYHHEDYQTEEVKLQWLEPGETHFEIISKDRKSFELCYNNHKDEWPME